MREYVSKMECEHCRQVWDIFREYFEEEGETCGVDAYPYGFVVLRWFKPGEGFALQEYFESAPELFEWLLEEVERYYLDSFQEELGLEDLTDCQLFERMPDVKKQELEERKKGFQESYERLRDSWK